jgi:hypothetical protein
VFRPAKRGMTVTRASPFVGLVGRTSIRNRERRLPAAALAGRARHTMARCWCLPRETSKPSSSPRPRGETQPSMRSPLGRRASAVSAPAAGEGSFRLTRRRSRLARRAGSCPNDHLIYLDRPPFTLLAPLADTSRFLVARLDRFFLLPAFAFRAIAVDVPPRARGYTMALGKRNPNRRLGH